MRCPECGRELTPKPTGRFKILCWPTHKMAAYGKERVDQTTARYAQERYHNPGALRDNEITCPNSGQPVED